MQKEVVVVFSAMLSGVIYRWLIIIERVWCVNIEEVSSVSQGCPSFQNTISPVSQSTHLENQLLYSNLVFLSTCELSTRQMLSCWRKIWGFFHQYLTWFHKKHAKITVTINNFSNQVNFIESHDSKIKSCSFDVWDIDGKKWFFIPP